MKTIRSTVCFAALAFLVPTVAKAGSPFPGSVFGSGYYGGVGNFFNPYSFPSSSSVRTPPYFAVHPPVYYSTRHARPYGMSPFAAPPMVAPSDHYHGRLRSEFIRPVVIENDFCEVPGGCSDVIPTSDLVHASAPKRGPVRENPFVTDDQKLAQTE